MKYTNNLKPNGGNGEVWWNPLTPLTFLKRSEAVFPNKRAVVYRDKSFTYKQFAGRVYRLANGLLQAGIGQSDRVAILSRNNNCNLESFYGIAMAGATSVPLNFRFQAREIAYVLNHSGARAFIFEHAFADTISKVRDELKNVELMIEIDGYDKHDGERIGQPYEDFLVQSMEVPLKIPVEDENDVLSICYTSGTTGMPKGCMHTHRGTYLNALGGVIEARMTPESSYLWTLPMFHSQGWCYVWAVTAVGARHVCLDAVRAEEIYDLMMREKITTMCGAPTACSMVTDYMKKNNLVLPHTVRALMGGSPPTARNFHDAWDVNIDIHHGYGLTECYGAHTFCEWNEEEWGSLPTEEKIRLRMRQGVSSVGGSIVSVVDDNMREVPHDGRTSGEIVMRGNNVMKGYYKEEDKTDEAFAGGWFHSGDLAVIDPDGYIRIVDRIKDIIITGGENVSSVEVEGCSQKV